jgi:hypothetical protein
VLPSPFGDIGWKDLHFVIHPLSARRRKQIQFSIGKLGLNQSILAVDGGYVEWRKAIEPYIDSEVSQTTAS